VEEIAVKSRKILAAVGLVAMSLGSGIALAVPTLNVPSGVGLPFGRFEEIGGVRWDISRFKTEKTDVGSMDAFLGILGFRAELIREWDSLECNMVWAMGFGRCREIAHAESLSKEEMLRILMNGFRLVSPVATEPVEAEAN
jgi:hypothetical protein